MSLAARFSTAIIICVTLFVTAGLSDLPAEPAQLPAPKLAEYRVAIHCSLNVLQLWRNAGCLREFPVETGKGGLAKRRGGDHKTPIGDYEITWMAARASKKGHRIVDGRSWCKDNRYSDGTSGSKYERLWSEPYGGEEAAVMSIDYPNAKDRARGYTGECLHIHSDRRHDDGVLRKSYGCIHMFPADARELYELVDVGTPVKILP